MESSDHSNTVIFIGGATASGKTDLSLDLARKYNGEIISADSRQIYIGMDIGTAKVAPRPNFSGSKADNQKDTANLYKIPFDYEGIPHYLIDIVYPDQRYTLFDFKNQAEELIADIFARGKTPIVVGGTGLYLDALIHNYQLDPEVNTEDLTVKADLEKQYQDLVITTSEEQARQEIHQRLAEIDPESAAKIPVNNIYFTVRALEFALLNGKPKTSLTSKNKPSFNCEIILTDLPRADLYKRIEDRIDIQLQNGLIQETETLISKYGLDLPALTSLGYKEIADYLNGQVSLEEATKIFKQKTRNYAKRQLTWFRRYQKSESA